MEFAPAGYTVHEGWNENVSSDGSESDGSEEEESGKHVAFNRAWLPAEGVIVSHPQPCPNAVTEYLQHNPTRKLKHKDLTDRIRRHLLYLGWKIHYFKDYQLTRMRYTSHLGKVYMSLIKVCQAISAGVYSKAPRMVPETNVVTFPATSSSTADPVFEPHYCPEAVESWCKYAHCKGSLKCRSDSLKAKKHLSAMGWRFTYAFKDNKRELRYWSPQGKCFYSLRTACQACIKDNRKYQQNSFLALDNLVEVGKSKGTKRTKRNDGSGIESRQEKKPRRKTRVKRATKPGVRSIKRVREAAIQSSSHCNPRTLLSWLIDNRVVLPSSKVQYISRKDGRPLKEGQVFREGIRCNCCDQIYSLSAFEAHAGSSLHRPSANIYLKDGRSLTECQRQLLNKAGKHDSGKELNQEYPNNDDLCSICHCEGELMLCDGCPSSFHISCLGLKEIPDGDWFCPSCFCLFCGQGEFKSNISEKGILQCYQCEHRYHLACLKQKTGVKLHSNVPGNSFCSAECKKIYSGLGNLLGKPFTIGADNLTWTLVAAGKCASSQPDLADNDTLTENYGQLNVALSIMHECFEPVKDPRTKRDLVEDIIFSRSSDYSRLNYGGFYTVILQKNDELITAATVRIFGNKMAEVPLVGTRLRYRRLGMCRVLMNELEKKLMELGIERLVLPAVPNMLSTWTNSFGFSQMTKSDRLQLLSYPLLDFVDTTLCQKFLQQQVHAKTVPSQGWQPNIAECDVMHGELQDIVVPDNRPDGPSTPPKIAELRQTSKIRGMSG